MNKNMKERDEAWIAELRKTLRRTEEPLPPGGWETLERALIRSDRRRRVFSPVWKKIAAAAAVVAIAVLIIGETVVNQGVVDGNRTFLAGESATADGQLLHEPGAIAATPDTQLAEKVRAALHESTSAVPAEPVAQQIPRAAVDPIPGGTSHAGDSNRQDTSNPVAASEAALPSASRSEESDAQKPSAGPEEAAAKKSSEPKPSRRVAASDSRRPSSSSRIEDRSGERPVELPRTPRPTSVGLYAAGLPTARHTTSGRATPLTFKGNYSLNSMQHIVRVERGYDDYLYRHKQPLSFGISVRKGIGHGLSLESGLVYSLLRSDVRVSVEDESFSQTLHMLGIPLRINWDFLARSNWKLYMGAGGMAEKVLYAKFGSTQVPEKALQWSLMTVAGAQYDFTSRISLYFEPGVSYYLTETDLRTSHTESPVNLSLQLGVRLTY